MLCVAPFIFFTLYGSSRVIINSIRNEINAYASAGAVAEEVLSGIRTVHSFNAQIFEINRLFLKIKII